ncbi:hypothetical protein [Vibrio phage 2 TSL-2019]|uniref:Uncharacterized protein n=1 Tax=Vibrio phage 2 TSL-2019 TaxID=2508172 RepID=A0A513PWL4_9CAUD|nr:hypothetical protein HWC03_gp185 [Vibrio phage 2 TSL-2019]QAU04340.1 hypothetical protein [Vibrio phage 2 TSL-2019]
MEISKTNKARIASGLATVTNTVIAEKVFDSHAIAGYHAVTGGLHTATIQIDEEQDFSTTDAVIYGASMIAGGTIASAVFKGIGRLFSGDSDETEEDTDEINQMITEVTGLQNPDA